MAEVVLRYKTCCFGRISVESPSNLKRTGNELEIEKCGKETRQFDREVEVKSKELYFCKKRSDEDT